MPVRKGAHKFCSSVKKAENTYQPRVTMCKNVEGETLVNPTQMLGTMKKEAEVAK